MVGHIHILCFIISHPLPNPLHSGFCQHCSTDIVLRLSVPCKLYFICNLLVFLLYLTLLMVHILSTLLPWPPWQHRLLLHFHLWPLLWDLCLVPWGSQLLHMFWVVFSSVTVSIFTLIMVFLVFIWSSCHDIYHIYGQNTSEIYFLAVLENNTKVKVLARLVHSAASLFGLQMTIFSFWLHVIFPVCMSVS